MTDETSQHRDGRAATSLITVLFILFLTVYLGWNSLGGIAALW